MRHTRLANEPSDYLARREELRRARHASPLHDGAVPVGIGCEAAAAWEHLVVVDAEGLDPALLTEGEADEEAQLDQLLGGEAGVKALPESVVGDGGVPHDGAGPGQRRLLALAEAV
jgi:hypothetical protein